MPERFITAYDVRTAGGIPPYSTEQLDALIFAFIVVSVFVAILSVASWKKDKWKLFLIPTLAVGIGIFLGLDVWDRQATAAALAAGKAKTVEGCVSNFHTNRGDFQPSRSSRPDEQWDLNGEHFSYKVTSDVPGYHEREIRGGVVHPSQYLRVSYLVSPILRRREIMKIEVRSERCG